MEKLKTKRTLNLRKYRIKLEDMFSEWKIILPVIIAVIGIIAGSIIAKGEGSVYLSISQYIKNLLIRTESQTNYTSVFIYLLIPTVFAVVIFFSGLSVYGSITVNIIPFIYGLLSGIFTYYLFGTYTLKGLGYIVIMFLPYAVFSLFSLILMTSESIDMSQVLLKKLTRSSRMSDYNFNRYYKNCLKSYVFIIIAAAIKTVLDGLFVGLFIF